MTLAETINLKVLDLPLKAQEEVLEVVEAVERRYRPADPESKTDGSKHVLDLLSEIQIDGPPDLAERHHDYAWGKIRD